MPSSAKTAENPLLEGLALAQRPDPCVMVIFGASGDLTKRKIVPAIYSLALRGLLPERFGLVGAARTPESDDQFRTRMRAAVEEFGRDELRNDVWEQLAQGMRYVSTDFAKPGSEERVAQVMSELDRELGTGGNRVYYLAVPPVAVGEIVDDLGRRRTKGG